MIVNTALFGLLFASFGSAFFSSLKSKFANKSKTPVRVAQMPHSPRHSIKRAWNSIKDVHNGLSSASLSDRVLLLPKGVLYHSHKEPDRNAQHASNNLIYKPCDGGESVIWSGVPSSVKAITANDDASVIAFYNAGKLHVKNKDGAREFAMSDPVKRIKLSADGVTIAIETQKGDTLIRPIADVLTGSRVDLHKCTKCRFDLTMGKALCLCSDTSKDASHPTLTLHHLNPQSESVVKHFHSKGDFGDKVTPVSWLVTPDGKHALISTSDSRIHNYDMDSGMLTSHTVTAASGKVKLKSLSPQRQFLFTLETSNKSTGAKELTVWLGDFAKAYIEQLRIPAVTGSRMDSKLTFDVIDPGHVAQRTVQYGSLPVHVELAVFEVEKHQ